MKKKVKLITTIASLCLAVALMAFGVYAATNVAFGVQNKVTFTAAANVRATVKHSIAVDGCEQTGASATSGEYDLKFLGNEQATSENTHTVKGGINIGTAKLTPKTNNYGNMKFSYTIEITNDAKTNDTYKKLKVVITSPAGTDKNVAEDGYIVTISYKNDGQVVENYNGSTGIVVENGKKMSYTVEIEVDQARSLAEAGIDLGTNVTLTAVA